ncbi:hypothetical protein VC83_09534 [Pseudogymnoascus destructans]|uniref:Vacuolar protein sorting-associated protein 52 n=2 Tax=Pseudogymnoascus destructans TaxID=655981 RepID=L8FU82_PSED2|nr:uncharacterized protein VC83_09534 [Pseudogymnoascus destructans]ELR04452.1 hypothetical protein GMDG_06765 [Pseudogymnoascus destructans 20631-21]OAF54180.1 hypothetical protein VC83_09534 [Pseudogymnoascus destructans]
MWLDRLSGTSTPALRPNASSTPQSRSYSPVPRKTSRLLPQTGPQRPNFSPRSSSLSAVSNDSTTSLLGNSRKPTDSSSSNLRNITLTYSDPIQVLDKLLNIDLGNLPVADKDEIWDNDELLGNVDFTGLALHEFVQEDDVNTVQVSEAPAAARYEIDKARFEDLHQSIRACNDILNSVELNLTSFQNDLGDVSAEIETLRARSTTLSSRIENRKVVELGLTPVVEDITVSQTIVKTISEGDIDESWIVALNVVGKWSKALNAKAIEAHNIKSITDLKPLRDQLVNIAIERIRDFLVAQIKALRSPNINAQVVQQRHFIRYKDLFSFLWNHHQTLAEEIGQAYMNTMRWYYLNHFTRYERALSKVKIHAIDKHDVLGNDDSPRKSTLLTTSKATGPPHDAFSLGRRNDILTTSNQSALPSHLAEDTATHYLEFPFRNFNLALIDNVCAEYSFLTTFFSPSLSFHTIARYFNYIFSPTFELGHTLTKSLVSETFDSFGLLLCVRLNQKFNFKLQRHKIPVGDSYINGTNMLLWPRFQVIMDLHCESVRKLTANLPTAPPTSKAELAKQSAAPSSMAQRFGQLIQGILELSKETGDDEPVSTSLARLRSALEAFLARVAKTIEGERKRERFLENSFSLILTIIGDAQGKLATEQISQIQAMMTTASQDTK